MESSSSHPEGSSEIVFFDLETTVPSRAGQRFWVLEFGAIIVCPRKLVELDSYSTLIRPKDLSAVALKSGRCDGITRGAVSNAPVFEEVADKIFTILNGRIWAGHNIQRFDCVRIREAFAEIGRPAPVPVGMIDSLGVLTERFGRRAGNMKMATLAAYFGLGQQKHRYKIWSKLDPSALDINISLLLYENCNHGLTPALNRSLDDVRMNLEESSLPSVLNAKWRNPSTIVTRSRSNGKLPCREENSRKSPPTTLAYHRAVPYTRGNDRRSTEEFAVQGPRDQIFQQLTKAFSFFAEMTEETWLPPLILHRVVRVDKDVSLPAMLDIFMDGSIDKTC
ncbi:hypothetical protein SADUNF_Sadunf07G0078300 [Salix dunnii]|uniref:Exonuclease domain-containing protein n=1 Tax=Salix dunnii TaxID=1413687 RepID=A0A835K036_9ROSI|nr:hypothetical protein SADUNF_Sadunf07G0078300 [Salix dunnii]